MNFAGYFVIVSDFIKWSKNNNISVGPGRGSGAGSIIAWSLQITDLDPIEFGLLFERFLNPERVSMPDFDIDFCQERREEVINYIRSKYGDERVGHIITFGKLQAKSVIKDVARVLGMPHKLAEYITNLVPFNAVNPVTLQQAIDQVEELRDAYAGKGLYNADADKELVQQILSTSLKLEGLHRHTSIHAAGIVIANEPLQNIVPIYTDGNSDMLIVQYSVKYCELAGLVKFDFLGLQTLTVIAKCIDELKKKNININILDIPYSDSKTFAMLSKGASTGIFQFESTGMKNALKRLKPDSIDDIIALGALYRPGPMENIPTYTACKHGMQDVNYLHPMLEPILKSTYGVIIYQEQVMEIAQKFAGYSLAGADILRKAMGKKVKAEMDAQEEVFINGAKKNGVSYEQAKFIFDIVAKFAGYGFNKSHASAYGVISYQTAYLKANFPIQFLVASLNLDIYNIDKISVFIEEVKNFNIPILPPCINKSHGFFVIETFEASMMQDIAMVSKMANTVTNKITDKPVNTTANGMLPEVNESVIGTVEESANVDTCQSDIDSKIIQGSFEAIIYGIGAIRNSTVKLGDLIALERKKNGKFKDIIDFLERIPPSTINRRALEYLIKSGCFSSIHKNSGSLIASIPNLMSYAESYHREKSSNQTNLIPIHSNKDNVIIENNDLDSIAVANNEFDALGLFINTHSIKQYSRLFGYHNISNSSLLSNLCYNGATKIKLAGVIVKKDARMSKRGRFLTLLISDMQGTFEVHIFDDEVFKTYAEFINVKNIVIVECDLINNAARSQLIARRFTPINALVTNIDYKLQVRFTELFSPLQKATLIKLLELLTLKNSNGNQHSHKEIFSIDISIVVKYDQNIIANISIPKDQVRITINDLEEIEKLCHQCTLTPK